MKPYTNRTVGNLYFQTIVRYNNGSASRDLRTFRNQRRKISEFPINLFDYRQEHRRLDAPRNRRVIRFLQEFYRPERVVLEHVLVNLAEFPERIEIDGRTEKTVIEDRIEDIILKLQRHDFAKIPGKSNGIPREVGPSWDNAVRAYEG